MRPTLYSSFVFLATVALLALAGCDGSVEKSPAFMKHTKQIEANTKDIQEIKRDSATMYSQVQAVEGMRADFQKVSTDVGTLMTRGGASPEGNKALEDRVQTLESQVQKLSEELAAVKSARGGRRAEPQADEAAPAESTSRGEQAAPAPRQRRGSSSESPAAVTWHQVKAGENLDDIARTYGVTADQIRAANHIPSGRNPATGMRIKIPR